MGSKRRNRDEIIYRILKACKGRGVKISKIADASNVEFKILSKYINLLIKHDLIEIVKIEAFLYKTTEKGIELCGILSSLER